MIIPMVAMALMIGWLFSVNLSLRDDVRGLALRLADLEATTYGDGK